MDKSEINNNAPIFSSYSAMQSYTPEYITVSRPEYDALLQTAREHDALREALYHGGVAPATLDILIYGHAVQSRKDSGYEAVDLSTTETHVPISSPLPGSNPAGNYGTTTRTINLKPSPGLSVHGKYAKPSVQECRVPSSNYDKSSVIGEEDTDAGLEHIRDSPPAVKAEKTGTLQITGLPALTTYKDITSVVRGSPLINVTISQKDRSATVTMLHGISDFLNHVKRHDLYIASKRVSAHLAPRQFKLSDHIRRQVLGGATRNLVIRNAASRFTEQAIRDDMAHIDKLTIIAVTHRGQDIYIQTNSVHGALFARTCMLSRKAFKNIRVEHFPDECAEALVVPVGRFNKEAPCVWEKKAVGNLYEVLDSWSEDGSVGCDVVTAGQREEDSDELIEIDSETDSADDGEGVSLGGF